MIFWKEKLSKFGKIKNALKPIRLKCQISNLNLSFMKVLTFSTSSVVTLPSALANFAKHANKATKKAVCCCWLEV